MTDRTEMSADVGHQTAIHTQTLGDDTVVASVTVEAPRTAAFTAFTDPEVLAQWFWPQRFGTRFECDLRPGGAFGIYADGLPEGQDMGVTGVYQDIEEPGHPFGERLDDRSRRSPARLAGLPWQAAGEVREGAQLTPRGQLPFLGCAPPPCPTRH